jgi:hypothetical protein
MPLLWLLLFVCGAASQNVSVLVVRISGTDIEPGTTTWCSNVVFGTAGRVVQLKSQIEGCSKGRMRILPHTGPGIVDGVTNVTLNVTLKNKNYSDYVGKAKAAAVNASVGADAVYWVWPEGVLNKDKQSGWTATTSGNDVQVRSTWLAYMTVITHEFGHTRGMHHSSERQSEYGDKTCLLGVSTTKSSSPKHCFNTAKTYRLNWFPECTEEVSSWAVPRSRYMLGMSEYVLGTCTLSTQAVIVRISNLGVDDSVFIGYNTATGYNDEVEEAQNMVTVISDNLNGPFRTFSYRLATLVVGDNYTYTPASSKKPVFIQFCAVVNGTARVATGPADGTNLCAATALVDECALNTDNCHANATCADTASSFTCACLPGFDGTGTSCTAEPPADECAAHTHSCAVNATCTNTVAAYDCACNAGFTGDGITCTALVNECAASVCAVPGGACTDKPIGYTCNCTMGWIGNGFACTDVNECTDKTHDCADNATCSNAQGTYTCACNTGYRGDGHVMHSTPCSDVDECSEATHNCGNHTVCTNTAGSFTCPCTGGFSGTPCVDVDECSLHTHNCRAHATCTNTPGSFTCTCNTGWTGVNCSNVDECAQGRANCDAHGACADSQGSFTCACNAGYSGSGVSCTNLNECTLNTHNCAATGSACTDTEGAFLCACVSGFEGNGTYCADLNECALQTDTCVDTATCTNTAGSFTCACNAGFSGTACTDVDECATLQRNCTAAGTVCRNTVGSSLCVCATGYTGDASTGCANINECSAGIANCGAATCTDTAGSFTCTCPVGFSGAQCTDINECGAATHNCHANATCSNTNGSFTCACKAGFVEDSANVTFWCNSTATPGPSCSVLVTYPTWNRLPVVTVLVAETDFQVQNKYVSQISVAGTAYVYASGSSSNNMTRALWRSGLCSTFTSQGTVGLPATGAALVAIATTNQVTKQTACSYALTAKAVVSHSSGLACRASP